MSDWLKTAISLMLVMAEFKSGKGKKWGVGMEAYLESLPLEYSTIMDWTDAEIAELKGTGLHSAVEEDRANGNFEKGWKTNVEPILEGLLKDTVITEEERKLLTFELFTTASKAVVTRGFNYSDPSASPNSPGSASTSGPFMIPLVDMLNHSSSPNLQTTVLQRDASSGCFYMDATRDVRAGSEVLHAYVNAGSNDELLRTYGFVDEQPEICTPKRVGKEDILKACKRAAEEAPEIQKLGGEGEGEGAEYEDDEAETWDAEKGWEDKAKYLLSTSLIPQEVTVRMENPLSDELVTACVIMMLSLEGFKDLFENDESPALLDASVVMEEQYLGCLVSLALLKLSEDLNLTYPTNIKEDEELLSSPNSPQRLRCAVTVRLEEKRTLLILKKAALKALHYEEEKGEKGGDNDDRKGEEEQGSAGAEEENKTKRIKLF